MSEARSLTLDPVKTKAAVDFLVKLAEIPAKFVPGLPVVLAILQLPGTVDLIVRLAAMLPEKRAAAVQAVALHPTIVGSGD